MVNIWKVEERILKVAREKQFFNVQGKLVRLPADFPFSQKGVAWILKSTEKKNLPTKNNQQECDSELKER